MATELRQPLEYYLGLDYTVNLFADEDGGYTAVFPDRPGCLTQGETLAEVAAMAEEARNLWIEVEYERGRDIPLPSYPDDEYSGQFRLRLAKSLHRQLAESAAIEGVSLNQYVGMLLARGEAETRAARRRPQPTVVVASA
jgi:predicted RNase H-like HicB family nuclease